MPSPQEREEALFQAASQLVPGERIVFLNGACLGDPAQRERLEALLAAHEQPEPVPPKPADPFKTIRLKFVDVPDEAVAADDEIVGPTSTSSTKAAAVTILERIAARRRYESANGLAMDVERHLPGETACADGRAKAEQAREGV